MKTIRLLLLALFGVGQPSIFQSFNPSLLYAQKPVKYKTVLSEAKAAIKNGKNQAAAEKNLLAIVNREDIRKEQRAEVYFTCEELQRSMNEAENMKLYLRQAYDTVKFFSTILRMHDYLLLCDSVESLPDEKGTVKLHYRRKSHELMQTYRPNLLNGGKFLLRKNKFAEAYPYFDMYLTTDTHPIMRHNAVSQTSDTLISRVAYWATISAYNANQPRQALKYIDKAMLSTSDSLHASLQEYKVRCYEALGDSDQWLRNLVKGTQLYPAHDYFYLHLMDVLDQQEKYDEGIALCDTMLSRVGDRAIYWYGESQMYLAKEDYDNTIRTADEALRLDTTMTDAYYNKGISFLKKASIFAETACNDIRDPKCRQDRQTLQQLYGEALTPMEEVRRRSPQDQERWASPLYRIYLNLNRGKEFAEMEKILNGK